MMLIGFLSFILQGVFPVPTGEYAVGRMTYVWVDESREEIYTEDISDNRELMVFIWYPADPAPDTEHALWLDEGLIEALAERTYQNPDNLRVESNAYLDAPPNTSGAPFPILIMSHRDTVGTWFYNSFAEELASHGYIVVGVVHTYNPWVMVFPDGRIIEAETDAQNGGDYSLDNSYMEQFDTYWDYELTMIDVWAEDLRFVVDQMENLNEDDPLAGLVDLSKVGVFGHALGGSAAVEALSRDSRFVAGASLDRRPSNVYENGLSQPILIFTTWPPHTPEMVEEDVKTYGLTEEERAALEPRVLNEEHLFEVSPTAYRVMIDGVTNSSYSDVPLVNDIYGVESGPPGSIDPLYGRRIILDVMLDFFEHSLNGEAALEDLDYPELHIEGHTTLP